MKGNTMNIMTPNQEADWVKAYERKRREIVAYFHRSEFELVVKRGITPEELPNWNRFRRPKL
jgi:hypothetical protein